MGINYLEKQYLNTCLFENEKYLEINYLPKDILHREQELIMLSKIFIKLIEQPFLISRKVLIQGAIGIGKTLIAKKFGNMLLKSAEKRNINIRYVHINCRIEKTNFKIVHKILTDLNYPVPKRGFSPQELISLLHNYLMKNEIYLFLVLDELNFLKIKDFNLIYSLTRLNEISKDKRNYISLISIVRDITLLRNFDESTISTLQGNILYLEKYTLSQIINILKKRIQIAIKKNVFNEKLIRYIAELIVQSGDLRKAFNIIRNTVKIAENKEENKVKIEDIHLAMRNLIPSIQNNALNALNRQQIILLYTLTDFLIRTNKEKASFKELFEEYVEICKIFQVKPRKNTQIWQNLQYLKNFDLISIDNISKNIRGRKSFYSIKNIPIVILNEKLQEKLRDLRSK